MIIYGTKNCPFCIQVRKDIQLPSNYHCRLDYELKVDIKFEFASDI